MYFSCWPALQERKLSAELFDSIREYARESHKGLAAHVFGPRWVDGHGVLSTFREVGNLNNLFGCLSDEYHGSL